MIDTSSSASTIRAALVFPTLDSDIISADYFAGEDVDFALFPEGYICNEDYDEDLLKLASDLNAPLLVGADTNIRRNSAPILPVGDTRLTDQNIESYPAQILLRFDPSGSGPIHIYTKHSTPRPEPHVGLVAFELEDWNPHNYLPTFDLGGVPAGATICHDHYLGLLQRHLAKNGTRIWLNPSYSNVVDAKWAAVLRLRAAENRVFALCTLHDDPKHRVRTHPFAFSPNGSELCARKAGSTDKRPISECKESDTVYIVDLDMTSVSKQLDWSRLPRANKSTNPNEKPQDPVHVSMIDGRPAILVDGGKWSTINNTDKNSIRTAFATVYVGIVAGSDILDAAACFQVIDNAHKVRGSPIIWNHWDRLPTTESDRIANLLKGRVIECCAPIVISDNTGIRELVELSNDNKIPVRRPVKLSKAVVDVDRAWGLGNAFKMVTKHILPENETHVLNLYRGLC